MRACRIRVQVASKDCAFLSMSGQGVSSGSTPGIVGKTHRLYGLLRSIPALMSTGLMTRTLHSSFPGSDLRASRSSSRRAAVSAFESVKPMVSSVSEKATGQKATP